MVGKYPDYLNDNKMSKFISNIKYPNKFLLVIEGGAITYDDKKLFSTKNVIFKKIETKT